MTDTSFIPIPGTRYRLNGEIYEVTVVEQSYVRFRGVDVKRDRVIALADIPKQLQSGVLQKKSAAPIEISSAPMVLNMPESERMRYLRRLAYVQACHREFHGTLPSKHVDRLIAEVAARIDDKDPPAVSVLYRWLGKYCKSGGNPLSQLENQGQPRTRKKGIAAEVRDLMRQYIRDEYMKNTRPTASAIYNLFVAELEANNLLREPDNQLEIPALMTFHRMIDQLDAFAVDVTRYGKETARRRQRYGKSILAPLRIGARVEADCHQMDVIVVDDDGKPIGRPYLCALIDIYSRCLLGWEISFTPPCGSKVLRALRHAMSDETARIYGGTPEALILDNGPEFQNAVLQTVAGTYGVALRYVEPRSPNQKPHIERFFGTVNTQLVHMMPGTTRSNPSDRGEYNSELNATLRLGEVRERFAFWLDQVYHQNPHSELGMPPSEMWRVGTEVFAPLRHRSGDLDLNCRSFVPRTISGGRVSVSNLEWTGPSLPEIAARLASKGQGVKTEVYYDETDLSFVWVQDPDDRSLLYKADAVDPEYQCGLSLYEHELLQQVVRKRMKTFSTRELREAKAFLYRRLAEDSNRGRKQLARANKLLAAQDFPNEETNVLPSRLETEKSTKKMRPFKPETDNLANQEVANLDGFVLE